MLLDRCNRPGLAIGVGILLGLAGTARAQTSLDLSLMSQYAARGEALSNGPAAQLRLEHNAADGWYGGVSASSVTLGGRGQGQLMLYSGWARRTSVDLTWDVGVLQTLYLHDNDRNYHEFYAGLTMPRSSARLYYSPAYFGQARSAYLELSKAHELADHFSVEAHLGLLHRFASNSGGYLAAYGAGEADAGAANRADARLSLVYNIGEYSVEAIWQTVWHANTPGARPARGLSTRLTAHF